MGVALGFGLTQSVTVLLGIFLMLGLGLAFPYLLIAIFPSTVKVLPRPGKWMNVVKQIMAFPLLLTNLWLIWILDQVRGTGAVIVALAGCIAANYVRKFLAGLSVPYFTAIDLESVSIMRSDDE